MLLRGTNYRLYTFINFYLSSIQQGIQSAHIVSELFVMYPQGKSHNVTVKNGELNSETHFVLGKWANFDKTIIICNGGMTSNLVENFETIHMLAVRASKFAMPHVAFFEDCNALGVNDKGLMTGFGIILPEEMWAAEPVEQGIGWANPQYIRDPRSAYRYMKQDIVQEGHTPRNVWIDYEYGEPETDIIRLVKSHSLAR